jgi:hypothetical protein
MWQYGVEEKPLPGPSQAEEPEKNAYAKVSVRHASHSTLLIFSQNIALSGFSLSSTRCCLSNPRTRDSSCGLPRPVSFQDEDKADKARSYGLTVKEKANMQLASRAAIV